MFPGTQCQDLDGFWGHSWTPNRCDSKHGCLQQSAWRAGGCPASLDCGCLAARTPGGSWPTGTPGARTVHRISPTCGPCGDSERRILPSPLTDEETGSERARGFPESHRVSMRCRPRARRTAGVSAQRPLGPAGRCPLDAVAQGARP